MVDVHGVSAIDAYRYRSARHVPGPQARTGDVSTIIRYWPQCITVALLFCQLDFSSID